MNETLSSVLDLSGSRPKLRDAGTVRDRIDDVVRLAVFGTAQEQALAKYAIHAAAPELGVVPSSIAGLYAARGRGEVGGFTVPAVNIRGMAYDMSRALVRSMHATNGIAVFELARSELGYTQQEPSETAAVVLAAAIAEGYRGPIFLQGDHYQANAKRFAAEPEAETKALEELVRKAIAAQFYNIDIDASTLVDLKYDRVEEQQAPNARLTAHLAQLVRSLEPAGVTISVGGEIGEVGKHNTTVEELNCYAEGFRDIVGRDFEGMSKVSVQTGTSHGGIPLADGSIASVALDFDVLRNISRVSRESYGMAGAVQHGASTLPDEMFRLFPQADTAEVHLATGFQNLLMDHPAFPQDLLEEMRAYCDRELQNEREPGQSDIQFFYTTRKKTWGPFKRQTWDVEPSVRAVLGSALQEKFEFLIRQLGAGDTRDVTLRHVTHKPVEVEAPVVS